MVIMTSKVRKVHFSVLSLFTINFVAYFFVCHYKSVLCQLCSCAFWFIPVPGKALIELILMVLYHYINSKINMDTHYALIMLQIIS